MKKSKQAETVSFLSLDEGYYEKFGEEATLDTFDTLKHVGLVDFERHTFDLEGIVSDAKLSTFFVGASVTSFGAKFTEACIPERTIEQAKSSSD